MRAEAYGPVVLRPKGEPLLPRWKPFPVPWGGFWSGTEWCGLDGFPCEVEPTHYAHWPAGPVAAAISTDLMGSWRM